ncbi:hypothetical protein BDF14DRAFT_1854401 [Spinellus fusiger]|nr:hypothetical protein BDF14DRAFT_1854401 [Spinellus fusiger]
MAVHPLHPLQHSPHQSQQQIQQLQNNKSPGISMDSIPQPVSTEILVSQLAPTSNTSANVKVQSPLDLLQAKTKSELSMVETLSQSTSVMPSLQPQQRFVGQVSTTATATTTPASLPHVNPLTIQSSVLRPGMGPGDVITNTMLYANDVLKDVSAILERAPLGSDHERQQLEVVRDGKHCTLAFATISSALKEGYKDETFGTADNSPFLNRDTTPGLIREEEAHNAWYEVGMDTDLLGVSDIMEGFSWGEDSFDNFLEDEPEEKQAQMLEDRGSVRLWCIQT